MGEFTKCMDNVTHSLRLLSDKVSALEKSVSKFIHKQIYNCEVDVGETVVVRQIYSQDSIDSKKLVFQYRNKPFDDDGYNLTSSPFCTVKVYHKCPHSMGLYNHVSQHEKLMIKESKINGNSYKICKLRLQPYEENTQYECKH